MTKEEFQKLENPPLGWHLTENIQPCYGGMSGQPCGKITEFMYPIFGKFACEDHRGKIMFMPLCCTHCFEPYWPNFPERAEMFGEKWTGHCGRTMEKCCHARDWEKEKEKNP